MKKVQIKLLNLSLISALCLLVSPKLNLAKVSSIRKLDNNQQLTSSERVKEVGKKEESASGLDLIEVETFTYKFKKYSQKKNSNYSVLFDRAISYFHSGLSPPMA